MNNTTVRRLLESERTRLADMTNVLLAESMEESGMASYQESSALDQHLGDLGSETFEREKAESILISTQAHLADVERALVKLSAGTYGTCEACGQPIAAPRLQARPAARFCIEDQGRVERQVAAMS